MKKIIGMIVLITLAGAGFVAAQDKESGKSKCPKREHNKKEFKHEKNFKGNKNHEMKGPGFSIIEIKEISGEIVVKENELPSIKSGNDEIKILLPLDAIQTLKLNTGSKISIKGIELPAFKKGETDKKVIKVFELQYEGKKFMVFGRGKADKHDKPKKIS